MIEYIKLFKALPVTEKTNEISSTYLKYGVLVEDSVIKKYSSLQLLQIVKKLVPQDSEINKTFHKSWRKIQDSHHQQLVIEQIFHYFTTYGLEMLGCYDKGTIFIPNEELKLEGKGGIPFYVLRGITTDAITDKVKNILSSGIALSDDDLNNLIKVISKENLVVDPAVCNNREMKVRLYDLLNITPTDPIEYLRLQVFKATDNTLLIKNSKSLVNLLT